MHQENNQPDALAEPTPEYSTPLADDPSIPDLIYPTVARLRVRILSRPVPAECREQVKTIIDRPDAAVPLVQQILDGRDREHLGTLLLDIRNRVIGYNIAYVGTVCRVACEPRGIFIPALLAGAVSIILFHNHPSGNPSPSVDDYRFTRRVSEAGEILGVRVVDHIVAGEDSWVSLRRRGGW